jgi:hypothetical protein
MRTCNNALGLLIFGFIMGGCAARQADTPSPSKSPPNRVGDRCIAAAEEPCYTAIAGTWRCGVAGTTFTVGRNGYVRLQNDIGQTGAGCIDCSGTLATLADDQTWVVPNGKLSIADNTATYDWSWCSGHDIDRCTSTPEGNGHTTCNRTPSGLP